jgi:adenylate kinase
MKLVLIAGSRETDKESIIGLALERLRSLGPRFKYLDLDKLGIKPGPGLGNLKAFPSRLHEKLEKELVSELKGEKNHMIISGSLTIKTPYGIFPTLTEGFFRVFKPDSLIILESSPGDLVRHPEASHEILRQQDLDRNYGIMYASISGSMVKVMTIEKSNIAIAVKELLQYLRLLFKE